MSDGATAAGPRRAVMWGADHVELGEIASAAVGERAAVAITRGRYAKSYGYTDPNEDVVAAVAGPRATLLACADGHNGVTSSHVAVEALLGALGDDPPPEADWLEVFGHVNRAVLAATGRSEQASSRCVLMAGLVAGDRLSFAAIGDAALIVCRPGGARGRQLNREAMRFMGYPMNKRSLKATVQVGAVDLEPGEWVVMATDGLSEFIAPLRPADIVPRVMAEAPEPTAEAAALAVVDAACSAGAGDNVGAVVFGPG